MRRTLQFAQRMTLLLVLLLLCGCGSEQTEERFETWRQQTVSAVLRFRVCITAACDGEQTAYEADVYHQGEETVLALTAPANIAGVTLRSSAAGDTLEYDGLELALFPLSDRGRDPCAAVPLLMRALREGRLQRIWQGSEYLAVELALSEQESLRLFLEAGTLTPDYAEITENGETVVFCHIENWTMGDS